MSAPGRGPSESKVPGGSRPGVGEAWEGGWGGRGAQSSVGGLGVHKSSSLLDGAECSGGNRLRD